MKFTFIQVIVTFVLVCGIGGSVSQVAHAEDSQKVFFHVRHVEETALYIDIGSNFGLHEGMTLPLFRVDPPASSRSNAPSTTLKPIASLKVESEMLDSLPHLQNRSFHKAKARPRWKIFRYREGSWPPLREATRRRLLLSACQPLCQSGTRRCESDSTTTKHK